MKIGSKAHAESCRRRRLTQKYGFLKAIQVAINLMTNKGLQNNNIMRWRSRLVSYDHYYREPYETEKCSKNSS